MPRKRSYKKRTYKRKKYSMQQQINWLMRKTKEATPQLEFDDTVATNADIYTTPTIVKIDANSDSNNRLIIKSIQAKFKLSLAGAQTSNQFYRIIIFTDKTNESGAVPTWGKIYKGASGSDAIISLRYIDQNENEGQRFKILYDKRVKLIKDEDGTTNNILFFDFYKKLNLKSILASGGTYWEEGGLYLAFVGTTATTEADLSYQIRCRYIDISD